MGGHTSCEIFHFFSIEINQVTKIRNPVKISWCLDNFSASQQGFKIFRYLNNGRTIEGLWENGLGLTLEFFTKICVNLF